MTITQQVESLLKYLPKTRSSDKELLLAYMQRFGMELTPRQVELFKKMPSVETIRRSRQAIQMDGKYPATKEVEEKRYEKYVEMKHGVEFTDPSNILETVSRIF